MDDLIRILNSGNANVKVEVNGEDLLTFSNELINRAKTELSADYAEAQKREVPHKRGGQSDLPRVRCYAVALEQERLSKNGEDRQ